MLLEVRSHDKEIYASELQDFLPQRLIDIHTHIWLEAHKQRPVGSARTVAWPSKVAKDNSVEDLLETYRLLFPDKDVTPLIFHWVGPGEDFEQANGYVSAAARKYRLPSFMFCHPGYTPQDMEQRVMAGGFLGIKVYLDFAPAAKARGEIEIYDFIPREQMAVLDRHGWGLMLHIPRDDRLRDPLNLRQMMEIDRDFPHMQTIIAHVGRAYCPEDVGNAWDVLADSHNLVFDFSANTCPEVFEGLIRCVGPQRILFGSDLPILRMRARRICRDGFYVNLVPPGLYGDERVDPHLHEVSPAEAESITFFLYEEILAMKRACQATGLSRTDVEDIFYNNAKRIITTMGGES